MESYSLPSEYSLSARKFKNIELLRFLMAWAIVGFHARKVNSFAPYELSFPLADYTGKGYLAVSYFFVVSFFFLVLKTRPDCSAWKFVRNKWLRMAPLIIVVTLIGYVLHLCSFWGWHISANLEQFLLIHDTCPADRMLQFVDPAWFCCLLFLSSILYLSWVKTLSAKHVALVVTSTAFIGLVLWRILPQLPFSSQLVGLTDYSRVFTCLGISYVLATVFVTPPLAKIIKYLSSIICESFVMNGHRNPFLRSFHSFTLRRTLVQTLTSLERNLLCIPVLPLSSEGGLPVPFTGTRLVRLARTLHVWYFHRSQIGLPCYKAHSFAGAQGMGTRSSMVSSRGHGMRHHAFSNAWLPLHRAPNYTMY